MSGSRGARVLVAVAMLSPVVASAAQISLSFNQAACVGPNGGCQFASPSYTGPGGAGLGDSVSLVEANGLDGTYSSTTSAVVGWGYFSAKAAVAGTALPGGHLAEGWAYVNGYNFDDVTFSSPGLAPGTRGVATAQMGVAGTLSASGGQGYASVASWAVGVQTYNGTFGSNRSGSFIANQGAFGSVPGNFQFTFDFVFNDPTTLQTSWGVTTEARWRLSDSLTGGSVGADADFVGTMRWLGITSVTDADGNPVQFTIDSASGIDWTQEAPTAVVPVPGTLWLLGSALGFIGTRIRRR